MRVYSNIWDVEAPESKAGSVTACVDPLHLLEGDVASGLLSLKRLVVARPHLGMRVVAGIGELVAGADRVEEFDSLISACCHEQLRFGEITELDDRGIVCLDPLVAWNAPWRPRLEELNEISLKVPNQQLTWLTLLASGVVSLLGSLAALLEFV